MEDEVYLDDEGFMCTKKMGRITLNKAKQFETESIANLVKELVQFKKMIESKDEKDDSNTRK